MKTRKAGVLIGPAEDVSRTDDHRVAVMLPERSRNRKVSPVLLYQADVLGSEECHPASVSVGAPETRNAFMSMQLMYVYSRCEDTYTLRRGGLGSACAIPVAHKMLTPS